MLSDICKLTRAFINLYYKLKQQRLRYLNYFYGSSAKKSENYYYAINSILLLHLIDFKPHFVMQACCYKCIGFKPNKIRHYWEINSATFLLISQNPSEAQLYFDRMRSTRSDKE